MVARDENLRSHGWLAGTAAKVMDMSGCVAEVFAGRVIDPIISSFRLRLSILRACVGAGLWCEGRIFIHSVRTVGSLRCGRRCGPGVRGRKVAFVRVWLKGIKTHCVIQLIVFIIICHSYSPAVALRGGDRGLYFISILLRQILIISERKIICSVFLARSKVVTLEGLWDIIQIFGQRIRVV